MLRFRSTGILPMEVAVGRMPIIRQTRSFHPRQVYLPVRRNRRTLTLVPVPGEMERFRVVGPEHPGAAAAAGADKDLAGQDVDCQEHNAENRVEQSRGHKYSIR